MIFVYVAARWENKVQAAELRDALAQHGIGCTSRWISEGPSVSSLGDNFDDAQRAKVAMGNVMDVRSASALVLFNPTPKHKVGTGGCHWETGAAYAWGLPIFLVGYDPDDITPDARSNIFHFLRGVRCFTWPHHVEALASSIFEACVDAKQVDEVREKAACRHTIQIVGADRVRVCDSCGVVLSRAAP